MEHAEENNFTPEERRLCAALDACAFAHAGFAAIADAALAHTATRSRAHEGAQRTRVSLDLGKKESAKSPDPAAKPHAPDRTRTR